MNAIDKWYSGNQPNNDKLPLFFNGTSGLRFIGQASSYQQCDDLLTGSRLSAQHLSTGESTETKHRAYIAHA